MQDSNRDTDVKTDFWTLWAQSFIVELGSGVGEGKLVQSKLWLRTWKGGTLGKDK